MIDDQMFTHHLGIRADNHTQMYPLLNPDTEGKTDERKNNKQRLRNFFHEHERFANQAAAQMIASKPTDVYHRVQFTRKAQKVRHLVFTFK
jgi:hypothetical protein